MRLVTPLEVLSLANRFPSGGPSYRWHLLSETGQAVKAYNGIEVSVEGPLTTLSRNETIVVRAG